jgi:hypothetical protein
MIVQIALDRESLGKRASLTDSLRDAHGCIDRWPSTEGTHCPCAIRKSLELTSVHKSSTGKVVSCDEDASTKHVSFAALTLSSITRDNVDVHLSILRATDQTRTKETSDICSETKLTPL